MSTVACPPVAGNGIGRLERLARVGLLAALVALLIGVEALARSHRAYASFTPQDLAAWTQAICTSIAAIAAAVNGLAVVIHRWGKAPRAPRKRRKGKDETPPLAPD